MKYRKFESDLAKKLHDASHPVDIDALIGSLHPEDKKQRRILPFFLAAIVTIGFGAWLFISQNDQDLVLTSSNDKTFPTTSADLTVGKDDQPSHNTTSSQLENETTNSTAAKINNTETLEKETISTTSNHIETTKKKPNLQENGFYEVSKNQTKSQLTTERHLSANATSISNVNETNSQSNNGSTIFLSQAATYGHDEASPSLDLVKTYTQNNLLEISTLPYSLSKLSTYRPRKIKKMTKVICPPFKKKNNALIFALVPEIGSYYPIKSLAATSTDNSVYRMRESNEKSLEGLSASLYLRVQQGDSPFYAQIGGSINKHTERMRVNYEYRTKDTIQGIISITESQNGDTLTVIKGDIIREKKITGSKTIHHKFSMIDIPLGIGYKKDFGLIDVGLEAGILANIKTYSGGRLFNGDTTFLAIDDLPVETFRPVLGLQYYAGLAAYYPLGKHGEIFASTRYRYIPKSFTVDKAAIGQRYQFAGLYLGYVRYL